MIPPAAALILMGVWNGTQARAITELESERRVLQKRIAAVVSRGTVDAGSVRNPRPHHVPSDWRERSPAPSDRLDERVATMTTDEMLATLGEIAAMKLSAAEREKLESILVGALISEDPQLALQYFADWLSSDSDGVTWQLPGALRLWAEDDPAAATAWLDRQIAEGKLDSTSLEERSEMRLQFEGALLGFLLAADPEAAALRLAALPGEQRREVLQHIPFGALSAAAQATYAQLVRGLVPESERDGTFAHVAAELVDSWELSEVGKFLDSVHATPRERAAAASDAANAHLEILAAEGPVTAAEADTLRKWLAGQAPGLTDSMTGKALAEAAQERGKFSFSEATALVLHYQQSSGSDDVLVAFLQTYSARSNFEEARYLADRITDATRREEILNTLK